MRTKVLSVIRLKALGPPVCACVCACVRLCAYVYSCVGKMYSLQIDETFETTLSLKKEQRQTKQRRCPRIKGHFFAQS